MRKGIYCLVVLWMFGMYQAAEAARIIFDHFIAADISTQPLKKINFQKSPGAEQFKQQLSKNIGQQANFAGKFILTNWSCGTLCRRLAIIDTQTGRVYVSSIISHLGFDFRSDSNLLIVEPKELVQIYYEGEVPKKTPFRTQFYVWDAQTFTLNLAHTSR